MTKIAIEYNKDNTQQGKQQYNKNEPRKVVVVVVVVAANPPRNNVFFLFIFLEWISSVDRDFDSTQMHQTITPYINFFFFYITDEGLTLVTSAKSFLTAFSMFTWTFSW